MACCAGLVEKDTSCQYKNGVPLRLGDFCVIRVADSLWSLAKPQRRQECHGYLERYVIPPVARTDDSCSEPKPLRRRSLPAAGGSVARQHPIKRGRSGDIPRSSSPLSACVKRDAY